MPLVIMLIAVVMMIRARPLLLVRLRSATVPSVTPIPAPLVWRSVSVVVVVVVAVVRPVAVLLPVARLPRPLVVVS